MDVEAVPPVLRMRLGHDASVGLVALLDRSHKEEREPVILACTERFERRLAEEIGGVRLQMAQFESGMRQEIAELRADLREESAALGAGLWQEMAELRAELRTEGAQRLAQLGADLRRDMGEMRVELREEIATGRVEMFKWCFLFWVGQVFAVSGIMGVMLRVMR